MEAFATTLTVLDYGAVAVFGASGALAAARRKQDIVTFFFFAAVTGVGGGTLRDVLIDAPVFWITRWGYVAVCLGAAIVIWVFGWGRRGEKALLWLDALGTCAYAIIGSLKAITLGVPPMVSVVMGVLTASFGGIIRDVLAGEPTVLVRRELAVTPSLSGAALFVGLWSLGVPVTVAGIMGFIVAFGLRAGAILFSWSLPGFPGRGPPEKPPPD
jgi:uncharacterized membrane protein YeiH